jgi:hypothetical protein
MVVIKNGTVKSVRLAGAFTPPPLARVESASAWL